MDLEFLMDLKKWPAWRILKKEVLEEEFPLYQYESAPLNSYQLVYALVDDQGEYATYKENEHDVDSFIVFTHSELASRLDKVFSKEEIQGGAPRPEPHSHNLVPVMLGELTFSLRNRGKLTSLKVNPLKIEIGKGVEPMLYAEDILFAPQFDETTQKYLLTDPDEAKALLAISPQDQKRFGIELVFYMMTVRDLPDEREQRDQFLKDKIEELSFMASRVPMKKGSASFLAVLLNLENSLEEQAFIRSYPMFDSYCDPIFVTSDMKILTGNLEEIYYDGRQIDTIFTPLIQWQQQKKKRQRLR